MKNILDPNSVHTRLRHDNSEKNCKKIQKIKKPLSSIIFSQNGLRLAKKGGKKFSPEFRSNLPKEENCEKNSKKIQKIKKPISGIIFNQNGMR